MGWLIAGPAFACGKAELDSFVALAQSLSPRAPQAGERLLSCPAETAEAAQWLFFYRATSKSPAAKNAAKGAAARVDISGEVGRAIAQAYDGNVATLKTRIDEGDPRYSKLPEAHLAVGRMLMRADNFEDARHYYENSLRLWGSAPAVEVEYLFGYIWGRDLDRAEREFNAVPVAGTAPSFAQAIERGKALVKTLKPARATSTALVAALVKPRDVLFAMTAETFVIRNEMQRLSGGVKYQGAVDARWQHHIIKSEVYDRTGFNTDEFAIGRLQPIGDSVTLGGNLGILTSDEKHVLGDLTFHWKLPASLGLGFGLDRRPLVVSVPLAKTARALVQDHAYVEASWRDRLTLRSAYLKDEGAGVFERHDFELRQPLKPADEAGNSATFVAVGGYEARALPSADYETYRRSFRVGVGGAALLRIGERWDAGAQLLYVLNRRQAHGSDGYLLHSGLDLNAEIGSRVAESLCLVTRFLYAVEETDRPSDPLEHRVTIAVAAEILR